MKISYKKLVDKLNSKINKYTVFAFCVSIILLIGLLYLFLEEDHFINLTYLIVPVVALASLYIVYLSIDVMQAGNKFAEGMLKFGSLKEQIEYLGKQGHEKVFSNDWVKKINELHGCNVSACSLRYFVMPLSHATKKIMMSPRYQKYLRMAKENKEIPKSEMNETINYVLILMELETAMWMIRSYYRKVAIAYEIISKNTQLAKSQKEQLFELLDGIANDYLVTAEAYERKDVPEVNDLLQIETFKFREYDNSLSDVRKLFDVSFFKAHHKIKDSKDSLQMSG